MTNITVELDEDVEYEEIEQVFQDQHWFLNKILTEMNGPEEPEEEYENGVYELPDVGLEDGEIMPKAFVELNDEEVVPGIDVSSSVRFHLDGVYDKDTREEIAETVEGVGEYGEITELPTNDREDYGEMNEQEILEEYVERGPMVHVGTETFGH